MTSDLNAEQVAALYTRRARSYVGYVQAFGHRQGLRAIFETIPLPGAGHRVLDAGCGTGLSILALADAARRSGGTCPQIDGFDLTPAMLHACKRTLEGRGLDGVELHQADICRLDDQLPPSWTDYQLIVCASMLEHLPSPMLGSAVAGLGQRLAPGGRLLAVVTRRSFYPARWIWHCTGYSRTRLGQAIADAGFQTVRFRSYPLAHEWLNIGNHVIEASDFSPH